MNGFGNVLTIPSLPTPSYSPMPTPDIPAIPYPYPNPASLAIPNISNFVPPVQTDIVKSGMFPTPYATDQPFFVPESVPFYQEPYLDQIPNTQQWFDWEAPLNTEGFTFADTSPAPAVFDFDWEAPLQFDGPSGDLLAGDPGSIMPTGFGEQDYYMSQSSDPKPGYGPIELLFDIVDGAGKVIAKTGEIIWDTGKFILDHLTVGLNYKGGIGGHESQQGYYEGLALSAGLSAEDARLYSMYAALQAASKPAPSGQTIPGQAVSVPGQSGQPIMVLPSQQSSGEPISTKLIIYAAVGVGVLLIASRIFKK